MFGLVTPSSTAPRLKGEEKARSFELDSSSVLPPPSDPEPLFLPSSPIVPPQLEGRTVAPTTDANKTPSSRKLTKVEDDDDDGDEPFVWGPLSWANRAYVEVPIVNGRGYARRKDKGKQRVMARESDLLEGV